MKYAVLYNNSLVEFDIGQCTIKIKVTVENVLHLPEYKLSCPITKLSHMAGKMKLKHVVVYEKYHFQ